MMPSVSGQKQPLRERAHIGARWMMLLSAVNFTTQLLRVVILARFFLDPDEFGLMGLVVAIIFITGIFSDFGMSAALIYRKNITRKQFSSIFFLAAGASLLLMAVLMIAAPGLSLLMNEERLTGVLRATALMFLFSGITIPLQMMMQRDLRFKEIALQDSFCLLAAFGLTVFLAWQGWGVWSLVWGTVCHSALICVLVVASNLKQLPLWHFTRRDLSGFLSDGLFQIGARIAGRLAQRMDQLLLAQISGVSQLGYYTVSHTISITPLQQISPIFAKVALPSFARIQNDIRSLSDVFFHGTSLLMSVTAPILVGIASIAGDVVLLGMGEKWLEMVPILQCLCIVGVFLTPKTAVDNIALVGGYANRFFYSNCIHLGLAVPVCFCGALSGGALGVAVALVVLQFLLTLGYYWLLVRPVLGPTWLRYLRAFFKPVAVTLGIPLAVMAVDRAFTGIGPLMLIQLKILAGVAAYGGLAWIFLPAEKDEVLSILGLKGVMNQLFSRPAK